jgi:hypothetical protein
MDNNLWSNHLIGAVLIFHYNQTIGKMEVKNNF